MGRTVARHLGTLRDDVRRIPDAVSDMPVSPVAGVLRVDSQHRAELLGSHLGRGGIVMYPCSGFSSISTAVSRDAPSRETVT